MPFFAERERATPMSFRECSAPIGASVSKSSSMTPNAAALTRLSRTAAM